VALSTVEVIEYPSCIICEMNGDGKVEAHYDAKTVMGPWGHLCEECFTEFGIGLGLGRGQRFIKVGG
jgi:hypothetical protein